MNIVNQIKSEKKYICECIVYWSKLRKFNASSYTNKDIEKMQYTISRLIHTIEKGMSLRNPRKGFGQDKVLRIIKKLGEYCDLYINEDETFLNYPIATIGSYIDYTKKSNVDIPHIESAYNSLLQQYGLDANGEHNGGILNDSAEHIQKEARGNFEQLLYSRHSFRYFDGIPGKKMIDKALKLAQRTPSACNRQAWKTHVYYGDKSVEIIKWQGGAKGFEEEIECCIIVTSSLKAFFDYEVHQAYVDGGLYAMNLINSLHYIGLATIPLSLAFGYKKLEQLKEFGIPSHELPILIVGVGVMPQNPKLAISERKDISTTNTFH